MEGKKSPRLIWGAKPKGGGMAKYKKLNLVDMMHPDETKLRIWREW
jgi:hypothetical protein